MSKSFSRRRFLNTALAASVLPILPDAARGAPPAPKHLVAGTRMLEVNGRPAKVFGLTGPDGRPGVRLAAGERFRVELANESGTRTLVHWHGQLPPWTQDGFPWPQTPPIANGAVQSYDYAPIPGTYWTHSHHAMQEQSLMTAPLIVHSAAELREDRQEVVLTLHDFTFRTPEEVLAGLTSTTVAAAQAMAQKTEEIPADKGDANVPEPRIVGTAARVQRMAMPGMTMSGPGGMQMHMDLNDVHYDAFLANDRTLADPEIARVERGGRIRLRVINGASSSQFWIDLGDLVGRVVATDGHPVHPVAGSRFPLAMAQRPDILIDLPRAGRVSDPCPSRGRRSADRNRSRYGRCAYFADRRERRSRAAGRSFARSPPYGSGAAAATLRGYRSEHLSRRRNETLRLVHERRVLAAGLASHADKGTTRRDRSSQPPHDGASDPSARPRVPGDRN